MRVIGIDPGVTGAYAMMTELGNMTGAMDLPVLYGHVWGKELKHCLGALQADLVIVELVHAMPKNGSKAAFSQGDSWGTIRTACECANIPWRSVTPATWKAHYGLSLPGKTDAQRKEASRAKAIAMFPNADDFNRKKDHNRAEAALIAYYGWETNR